MYFQISTAAIGIGFVVFCVATPGGFISGLTLLAVALPFLSLGYYFWFVVRSAYLDIVEEIIGDNINAENPNGKYVKYV